MADGVAAFEQGVDESAPWWQTRLHGMDRRDHRRLLANSIFHSRPRPDPSALIMQIRTAGPVGAAPMVWIGDAPFADLLDEEQAISCLPSGRIRFADPSSFITAFAARCCDEIAAVHETGPLILGGFCFDAWVAYEVAIRLMERGWEIQRVIMVEAYTLDRAEQAFNTYANHLRQLSSGPLDRRARYLGGIAKQWFGNRVGPSRSNGGVPETTLGSTAIEQDILDLTHDAIDAYQPPSSDIKVDLIFGDESMQGRYYRIGPRLGLTGSGWHRILDRTMTAIEAPGGHDTILDPDHIQSLAEVVQARIDHTRAAHRIGGTELASSFDGVEST